VSLPYSNRRAELPENNRVIRLRDGVMVGVYLLKRRQRWQRKSVERRDVN
jgi:hypothetical protein